MNTCADRGGPLGYSEGQGGCVHYLHAVVSERGECPCDACAALYAAQARVRRARALVQRTIESLTATDRELSTAIGSLLAEEHYVAMFGPCEYPGCGGGGAS